MLKMTTQHVFSGICICGHDAESHHGSMIFNKDTIEKMQSHMYLGECLHYGCNENWQECPKCIVGSYLDKDDPLKDEKIKEYQDFYKKEI